MNIKIICLGKVKEKSLIDLIDEYKKRISKYSNIEIIELADEPIPANPSEKEVLEVKRKEAEKEDFLSIYICASLVTTC